MDPNKYIQTETGKRMYNAVTPVYTDQYQLSLFNANGTIMEDVHDKARKLNMEVLINSATWSLPYWEELFRIKSSDRQTVEERRQSVILKMNEYFPVTKRRMEYIVEMYIESGQVSIDDARGDYIFEILFKEAKNIDFENIIKAVEEIKPAHLSARLTVERKMDFGIFFGGATSSYSQTHISPPKFEMVDLQSNIYYGALVSKYEKTNIGITPFTMADVSSSRTYGGAFSSYKTTKILAEGVI